MAEAYRDPTLPLTDRVEDLLGRMNLDEKLAQRSWPLLRRSSQEA